jgi:hypothetical protein
VGEKLRAGRDNSSEEFRPPGEALGRDKARASSSRGGGALWAKARALDGVRMAGHRAGAASKRGHTLARPNWLKAGANRVKQARGQVSHLRSELGVPWRGLGELDERGGGRGSPVRSDGVGRALAREGLRELRRGSECGRGRGSKRS